MNSGVNMDGGATNMGQTGMYDAQSRFSQHNVVGGHPSHKMQDMLRTVNNKSGNGHVDNNMNGTPADYIAAVFN